MKTPDPLEKVLSRLKGKTRAEMIEVARASGVSYDTVMRIASSAPHNYDPGYSKVRALYAALCARGKA